MTQPLDPTHRVRDILTEDIKSYLIKKLKEAYPQHKFATQYPKAYGPDKHGISPIGWIGSFELLWHPGKVSIYHSSNQDVLATMDVKQPTELICQTFANASIEYFKKIDEYLTIKKQFFALHKHMEVIFDKSDPCYRSENNYWRASLSPNYGKYEPESGCP